MFKLNTHVTRGIAQRGFFINFVVKTTIGLLALHLGRQGAFFTLTK